MKKSFLRLACSGCFCCCCSPAGVLARYTPNRRAMQQFLATLGSCRTLRSTKKTRSSISWLRALIRASGLFSRPFWKIASTYRNQDQKVFLVKPGEEDATDA